MKCGRRILWGAVLFVSLTVVSGRYLFNVSSTVKTCPGCNVILITIDALRADHLQTYGYSRPTSPQLLQFSADSWVFDRAFTPRPETTESMVSYLSGLDPIHSGVRKLTASVGASIPLLQEILKQHGLITAAFVSNWVLQPRLSGLNRGFDKYDFEFTHTELNRRSVWERNADETNAAAFSWLKDNDGKPFFLWIHYIDPHGPYTAPVDRLNQRFKHAQRKLVAKDRLPTYQYLPDVFEQDGQTDILDYVDRYDEEIQYVDQAFGALIQRLESQGLLSRSLVVVGADHGESHDEHNYFLAHGQELYDDNMRVPLMIHFPNAAPNIRGRTQALASVTDVFPTVLEFLGIRTQAPIDGVSLLPLLQGADKVREEIIAERFDSRQKYYKRVALRTREYKLLRRQIGNHRSYECYHMTEDPQELNPNGCNAKARDVLQRQLDAYIARTEDESGTAPQAPIGALDANDKAILKSLGYLN